MSNKKSEVTANPVSKATARFVRATPMKARRILNIIKGKKVEDARNVLRFAPQAAAEPVAKLLDSAIANAENNQGLDPRTLVVATAFADEGPVMKRIKPGSHGRAFRIRKRTSHITIVLESIAPVSKPAKSKARTTAKKGA